MRTIRWGIIGVGDVCEVKSGPGFQRAAGSALVAVMRRDLAAARDFARRHGVPRAYGDAEALIADPEVDAVAIATPPGNHAELALRVAAAGKPCYVEKPMARTGAECQRMVDAFAARRLPLFVAYYRRALPRFVRVRELVRSGAIGRPTAVTSRLAMVRPPGPLPWRLDPERSGGGDALDLGSHVLDLIAFLLGDLDQVCGLAANRGQRSACEDAVVGMFSAGGVPGSLRWDFAGAQADDELEIRGTHGRLRVPVFADCPLAIERAGDAQLEAIPHPPHVQQPLIQTVVDELLGCGRCPSTGVSAARASAALDRLLAGYYGGREDGFWGRPEAWPGARSLAAR